jgi:hypothetical protein
MIHPVVYKVTARLQNVDAAFLCDNSISTIHHVIRTGQALASSSLLVVRIYPAAIGGTAIYPQCFPVTARHFSRKKPITLHNSRFYHVPSRLVNFKLFVQRYDKYVWQYKPSTCVSYTEKSAMGLCCCMWDMLFYVLKIPCILLLTLQ